MSDSDKSIYSLRYNQLSGNLEGFGGGSPQWTNLTLSNVDPTQVPVTRQINTTAPLLGGGNLTADLTLSIPQATSSVNGYLLAADWTTFNSKLTSVLTSANIFVGNGSNVAVGVPLSGDAILSNAGAITLQTVNANVGSFTNANVTVDAKGRITAASNNVGDITQLTGDVTAGPGGGSQVATLATVNGNVGSFTYTSLTVNAKGLITAASSGTAPVTSVSGTANQITSTGGTTPVLAIANPLTLPGATTAGGAIAMASNKITGLANGTGATDAAAFGQIPVITAPTVQRFLSGSGTYTKPAGVLYLKVTVAGPGGGGGGGGTTSNVGSAGSAASTFSAGSASAGAGNGGSQGSDGGTGGTNALTTGTSIIALQSIAGMQGGGSDYSITSGAWSGKGGQGGGTPLGSGATGSLNSAAGHAGRANTGEGGSGGGSGVTGANNFGGTGGGSGGYLFYIVTSPSATYTYAIGTGGAGGTSITGAGGTGGAGASGIVVVEEYYQ